MKVKKNNLLFGFSGLDRRRRKHFSYRDFVIFFLLEYSKLSAFGGRICNLPIFYIWTIGQKTY